jgi:hypothetical protein
MGWPANNEWIILEALRLMPAIGPTKAAEFFCRNYRVGDKYLAAYSAKERAEHVANLSTPEFAQYISSLGASVSRQ